MKKVWSPVRIGTTVLMFALLFGIGGTAEAAPNAKPENLKHTGLRKQALALHGAQWTGPMAMRCSIRIAQPGKV